jgi:methenyltetrahydrofolate cyclohydrolase
MKYIDANLSDYISEVASRSTVPGGGSAAALSASLGAALNLMVINYSQNTDVGNGGGLTVIKVQQEETLDKLKHYVDQDCVVFKELMDKLASKESAEEEYKRASEVPLGICEACVASIGVTAILAENSNKNLITDVGSAAYMLRSAFSSAAMNVYINLKYIKDDKYIKENSSKLESLEKVIAGATEEIVGKVQNKIN